MSTFGTLVRTLRLGQLIDFLNANPPATQPYDVQRTAYGARGDGTTDDRAAFLAADTAALLAGAGTFAQAGTYRIASSVTLSADLECAPGVRLKPDAGVTITLSGRVRAARGPLFDLSASGSTVRLWQQQDVYPEWFGVIANDATKGAVNSVGITAAIAAMSDPTTFFNPGGILEFDLAAYEFAAAISVPRQITIRGLGPAGSPTKAYFPDGTDGFVVEYYHTGAGSVGRGDLTTIEGIDVYARGKLAGTGSGFVMKSRGRIRRCGAFNFGLDGSHVVADAGGTPPTNANLWIVDDFRAYGNGRHGHYAQGGDSNAGYGVMIDAEDNGGYGIKDDSFLGNTYTACHASGNTLGPYWAGGATSSNVFFNCYSESGQPGSVMTGSNFCVGGLHAAGFVPGSGASNLGSGRIGALQGVNGTGATATTFTIGGTGGDAQCAAFGSQPDAAASGGLGYRIAYGKPGPGWFGFQHAGLDNRIPIALGGALALDANGRSATGIPLMQNGVLIGPALHTYGAAAPTTGIWIRGDRVYTTAPVSGGIEGWICVTSGNFAGTPPVFKAFGSIA